MGCIWFDVCWCYVAVWLGWCGIRMQAEVCDLFVELFHGLCCSGSMCVGVTLQCGWSGVVSVCRLKSATYLLSYFMGCVVLVRCVLVLVCSVAGVVWYPYAG